MKKSAVFSWCVMNQKKWVRSEHKLLSFSQICCRGLSSQPVEVGGSRWLFFNFFFFFNFTALSECLPQCLGFLTEVKPEVFSVRIPQGGVSSMWGRRCLQHLWYQHYRATAKDSEYSWGPQRNGLQRGGRWGKQVLPADRYLCCKTNEVCSYNAYPSYSRSV